MSFTCCGISLGAMRKWRKPRNVSLEARSFGDLENPENERTCQAAQLCVGADGPPASRLVSRHAGPRHNTTLGMRVISDISHRYRFGVLSAAIQCMRVFLTGVACVGKTTIGVKLADLLGCQFFDLDTEIERFFGTSIERLRQRYLTPYSFRKEASKALKDVLSREGCGQNCVIALPPSGLMDAYWKVVKTTKAAIVVLQDKPENILKRITFYDLDSRQIERHLTEQEKRLYLRETRGDITYFGRTYKRATATVEIAGLGPDDAAHKVRDVLNRSRFVEPGLESLRYTVD